MFSYDIKFLSNDKSIHVKDDDTNIYKYENKAPRTGQSVYLSGKRNYHERRGQVWVPTSKGPTKLKESLQKIDEQIKKHIVVFADWRSETALTIIFSSGLLVYIIINKHTHEIEGIYFDRYCMGKISSNTSSAIQTGNHIIFVNPENQVTIIHYESKQSLNKPLKLSKSNAKFQTVELFGPLRKCERILSYYNDSEVTLLLIWSCSTSGEIFPWTPTVKGEDRANIHIYSIHGTELLLIGYHHTENETVNVELSKQTRNIFYTIEQRTKHKSGMLIEGFTYKIINKTVNCCDMWTCNTQTPIRCVVRNETNVLMSCIDSTIVLRTSSGLTKTLRAPFVPTNLCWTNSLLMASDERGRLAFWDRALQALNPRVDLTPHLTTQPTLQFIISNNYNINGMCSIILMYNQGPIALLKLTIGEILKQYLELSNVDAAINLLSCHNWNYEGDICLKILYEIVRHCFRNSLNEKSEIWIQNAIGTFMAPSVTLDEVTLDVYSQSVHDIARKFFHRLLKNERMEIAMSLAIDLEDYDLFIDIEHLARRLGNIELAEEAHSNAERLYEDISSCSVSCCSDCSNQSSSESSIQSSNMPILREPPPLPYFDTKEVPIAVIQNDAAPSTSSIRPNIHQYLDREKTLYNNEEPLLRKKTEPAHQVVDVIPKPKDKSIIKHYNDVYQKVLKEESNDYYSWRDLSVSFEKRAPYKPVYSPKSALANQQYVLVKDKCANKSNGSLFHISRGTEKSKVKFSDTVTVAVVPENRNRPPNMPDPERELAESLPLCHPDLYLKDFTPLSADTTYYV